MQPLPGFESSLTVFYKCIPAVEIVFEGHDPDLDTSAVQFSQPLGLGLAVLAEVEACGENPQGEVGVPSQKLSHVPGTVVAGAPGGEPGDAVTPAGVQVPVRDVA